MNTFPYTEKPLAHFNLVCTYSTIVVERLLQTLRYRGFELVTLNFNLNSPKEVCVSLVVKGQGKLTTLQKSFESIIEVQECYLTEDEAKLAALLDIGRIERSELNNSAQHQTS